MFIGKRLTYEYIKKQIEQEGYKLLSKNYINNYTKLKLKCSKDHIYKVTWGMFKQGQRCPECNRLRQCLNINDLKEKVPILAIGYALLSNNYKNANTKIKFKCNKNHEFFMIWNAFQQGERCPVCSNHIKKSFNEIKKYIEKEGYKLLSKSHKTSKSKILLKCPKGHTFKTTWNYFKKSKKCSKCSGLKKLTYKYIKEEIEKENYKLLSNTYINALQKLKVQCPKGHEFKISWNGFQQGQRCKKCFYINNTKNNHCNWKNYTNEQLNNMKGYKDNVIQLSNQNYKKYYYSINPQKLKRGYNDYHLDHIYSTTDGFKNNVPVEVISNPNNLQMLWCLDNQSKNYKSDVSKIELYTNYYKYYLNKKFKKGK